MPTRPVRPTYPIEPWVFRELEQADFGDARLTARILQLVSDLGSHPEWSLASLYEGDWASLKAGYRFFDNAAVTPSAILAPHREATWARSVGQSRILVAQDTTYLNFTGHAATQGLGPVESLNDRGLMVHTGLAITTDGVPLGIVAQQMWARDPDTFDKSRQRRSTRLEDKESYRWIETAEEAIQGVPDGTRPVIVGDRESDIFDVFVAAHAAPYDVLVRGAWNRRLIDHPAGRLWPAVEAAPVLGTWVIDVPRKEGQPVRQARLAGQTTRVSLAPPAHRRVESLSPVSMTVVLAREVDPPPNTTAIEWLLLTTLPVETLADAQTIVQWYTYRWRIERLHFVLKTGGCFVEKLQLETVDRLTRAITVYTIIAWRILWMTYHSRQEPNQPYAVAFTPEEQRALWLLHERQRPRKGPRAVPGDPSQPLTLREAMHTMAKLGGFLGRKSDGEPGVKTLWRGYRQLQWLLMGMHLAAFDGEQVGRR